MNTSLNPLPALRRLRRSFRPDPFDNRVLVSFPKSGRTWLRVILDDLEIKLRYTHDNSSHSKARHFHEMENCSREYKNKKVVFMHRDPRDTAVSGYYQASKRLKIYEGSVSDFIRSPMHGVEKIVVFNKRWLNAPLKNIHAITYEAMKQDTATCVRDICAFLKEERGDDAINAAIAAASFGAMQKKEKQGAFTEQYGSILTPGDSGDDSSLKVRKGIAGGFKKELSAEDNKYCQEIFDKHEYWPYIALK